MKKFSKNLKFPAADCVPALSESNPPPADCDPTPAERDPLPAESDPLPADRVPLPADCAPPASDRGLKSIKPGNDGHFTHFRGFAQKLPEKRTNRERTRALHEQDSLYLVFLRVFSWFILILNFCAKPISGKNRPRWNSEK